MKLFRRFLVILLPPLILMVIGVVMIFNGFGGLGVFVTLSGYMFLPLTPYWAYPIIERMEDRLDRR